VPLGRNRARPSRTVWAHGPWPRGARPVLVALAQPACAAQLDQPAQCVAHSASTRAAVALLGEPTAIRRRRMGDGRGTGGSPVRGRRATSVALDRCSRDGGAVGEASGVRREAVGTTA
jgi:hypothetical protein